MSRKISIKAKKSKVKKAVKPKVAVTIDVLEMKNDGVIIEQRYYNELLSYNKMRQLNAFFCQRWRKGNDELSPFECFLQDMGPKPFNRYVLQRIDRAEVFTKNNCVWVRSQKSDNLLAFDPGVQNFGACWIKRDRVMEAFVLANTLEYVRQESFDEDVAHFKSEFESVLDKRQPNVVVIERFVPRRFSTGSAESINVAIGIMLSVCYERGIPVFMIMSSTWKNAMKKFIEMEDLYKEAKAALGLKKVMPHTCDAMCLGRYLLNERKVDNASIAWLRKNLTKLKKL